MNKRGLKISFLVGLLFVPIAQAAELDVSSLSESKVTLVDVSKAGQAGKSFQAGTLIAAPIEKLCATVQDYAAYPGFMPNLSKIKVSPSAGATLLDMTLKLPLGKIKKYRLKMEPKVSPGSCQLSWKLVPWEGLKVEETIADTTGYWLFSPLAADKHKTVVKYVVTTDPGPVPMGLGWIVDSLSKDSIPKTLEALRSKVTASAP